MLVRVWEYEVAPGCEVEFEQLYGSAAPGRSCSPAVRAT